MNYETHTMSLDTATGHFITWCHIHRLTPDENCGECKVAFDVNFGKHNDGTCLTGRCPFHE